MHFLAVVLGLSLGSFLGVVVHRLPWGTRLLGRLHCTRCGHPLTWEALPLAGYLLQRGRCRHCGRRIPAFFPLVETLTTAVFVLLAWRLGASWLAALYAVFGLALILTLFVDWLHQDIYYVVVLPPTLLALLAALLRLDPRLDIRNSLLGLVAGTLFFGLLFILGQVLFHSQALGLGDVWLAGMIGAMMGLYGALMALSLGIILAAVGAAALLLFRRAKAGHYMPYGAFLCLGALAYLCFWAP